LEPNKKSTATVMLAFFVVMASFLAFIIFIPHKELVHWLSFLFILLAEFTFFIAHLFLQMLPDRPAHRNSRRLLLSYLILTIVLAIAFMILRPAGTGLVSGVLLSLFVLTLIGLIGLSLKRDQPDEVIK